MKYSYVPESGPASDAYDPWAVTREPFPVPLLSSRDECPDPAERLAPLPVLKLAEFAREYSWEVRTQYSQGNMPHAVTGRPGILKDLIALRFGAHPMTDRQAYAVYARQAWPPVGKWSWSSVMIWGPDLPPFGGCGITELKNYLSEPDTPTLPMLAWVDLIKRDAENAAKLRAARPKPAPKPREGMS